MNKITLTLQNLHNVFIRSKYKSYFLRYMVILLITVVACGTGVSQTPVILSKKIYGGTRNEYGGGTRYVYGFGNPVDSSLIVHSGDGGFVFISATNSSDSDAVGNHGDNDFMVVKTDQVGNKLWVKLFGGNSTERPKQIIRTRDGGFLISGETYSNNSGDVTGYHGSRDVWLIKLDASGNLIWQKALGGSDEDEVVKFVEQPDGDIYLLANSNSTNGDITVNKGMYDVWLLKLNSAGSLLWQKSFGGNDNDMAYSMAATPDNGFIIGATTNSINNGDVTGSHGGKDIWVIKTDDDGNVQWKRCYGGTRTDGGGSFNDVPGVIVKPVSNNQFVIFGNVASPDGDIVNIHTDPAFTPDIWVARIDNTGAIIWAKCYGSSEIERFGTIQETADGGFVFIGETDGNDGDVSGYHHEPNGNYWRDAWIVKLSQSGNLEWQKCLGGNEDEQAAQLLLTPDGGYLTLIESQSGVSGDITNPRGASDVWVVKLNAAGNLVWQKSFGTSEYDRVGQIVQLGENAYQLLAFMARSDKDNVGGYGNGDAWFARIGSYNTILGTVYLDRNKNGIKDAGEPFFSEGIVKSENGLFSHASKITNGVFVNLTDSGNYQTAVLGTNPNYSFFPTLISTNFNSYGNTDSISFAAQPISGRKDYRITLFAASGVRPGFFLELKLKIENPGTDTLSNRLVTLVKDSRIDYLSADIAPGSISGDTLRWIIPSLLPLESQLISLHMRVKTPPAVNVGSILTSYASIDSVGDIIAADNLSILTQIATGSYDPNDKQETHGGSLYINEYNSGRPLNYSIRFQNTGNDTAFTVVLRDTLSDRLDWNSIEMINASHPYKLEIKNGKYCTWTFSNILLVDSNHNEPQSHGYISYRIKPKNGLVVNDVIHNSASIYFDFNLPVRTNIHETVIKPAQAAPPPTPAVTGLLNVYCNNLGQQKGKITNLPAAASGITVTVKLDATVLSVAADSTFSFDVNPLTVANHTITVSFSNGSDNKTFTDVFSIAATVTPDVNVSANITNITNLATPVIITGTNASGGGTAPLYSFAKDRTFTTILQAEGINNILNIDPSSLTIGDNWIYIRMKSNATCITSQISIDSIKLVRDMLTGITDPDNPGTIISLYPNPFNKQVFINGLSAGKSYMISITNLNGQLIQQNKISNRTNVELVLKTSKAGTYLLTIYDEKKKLSLGTMKIIKQ